MGDRFSKMRAVATAVSRIEPIEDLEWIRKAVDDEISRRKVTENRDTND